MLWLRITIVEVNWGERVNNTVASLRTTSSLDRRQIFNVERPVHIIETNHIKTIDAK